MTPDPALFIAACSACGWFLGVALGRVTRPPKPSYRRSNAQRAATRAALDRSESDVVLERLEYNFAPVQRVRVLRWPLPIAAEKDLDRHC